MTEATARVRHLLRALLAPLSDEREPDMTARLFRGVALALVVVLLGLLEPVNLLQDLGPIVHLPVVALGLSAFGFYRLALQGRYRYRSFFVVLLVALDGAWFASAGSNGSANMWLFGGAVYAVLFFRGRDLAGALVVFLANGVGLYLVERVAPWLVVPFRSPSARLHDMWTGFVLSNLTCALVVWVVLNAYRSERARLSATVAELERRVTEVHTLRGLLPICAWCKKVRTDTGLWTQVERYLATLPEVQLTHSLCPECQHQHFPGDSDER